MKYHLHKIKEKNHIMISVDAGKFFHKEECQLINVEQMLELGNYHFSTTIEMIVSDKNYPWMLKLVSKSLMRTRIVTQPQSISLQARY